MEKYEFEKSEFYGLDEKELVDQLETYATKIKDGYKYAKPLTQPEIEELNNELHQAISEMEDLKEQIKAMNSEKRELDITVRANSKLVRQGFQDVSEKVWVVNNNQTGYAETINAKGEIIEKHRFKVGTEMNLFDNRHQNKQDVV